ncbi:MAG: exodeoxyribonuclease VII large subunit [Oscillospiraceae bacterium]|nr:exodeoxyribonuclease VII large subunit [Oscillospiraceae bacterium]
MEIYSVSQINRYVKEMLDTDSGLRNIYIRGELSGYKIASSGHHYFTLKDEKCAIDCAMFRNQAATLKFKPENGMQVIALGRVSLYPEGGKYQLYVNELTAEGLGDLYLAFEQMKEKLTKEGLFDEEHKKALPAYPEHIILITSESGAAVQDMIRILGTRWPRCRITLIPVLVQGEGAAEEIAAAVRWANANLQQADLIITGRGGGSYEDLMAFNAECVARAIYDSEIPVISAVGHEPDVTIADYVADVRASTPSNAAELAVPDQDAVMDNLEHLGRRMKRAMERILEERRLLIGRYAANRVLADPLAYVQDRRMQIDLLQSRMVASLRQKLNQNEKLLAGCSAGLRPALQAGVVNRQKKLSSLAAALDAMSPLKVLGRGYSIATDDRGSVISSVKQTKADAELNLRLCDGSLSCRVEEVIASDGDQN